MKKISLEDILKEDDFLNRVNYIIYGFSFICSRNNLINARFSRRET